MKLEQKIRTPLMRYALVMAVAAMALATPVAGQADDGDFDIDSLFNRSTTAMESGRWEDALGFLDRIIKTYEGEAATYGASFGIMYYRVGFCHKNLGNFDKAIEAYKVCYEKYKNTPETPAGKTNQVWDLSVLELGIVYQAEGDYESALKYYTEFAALRVDDSRYNRSAFLIAVATSMVKTGDVEGAQKIVDQIFEGEGVGRMRPDGYYRAFMAVLEGWAGDVDRARPMELAAHGFLDKHSGKLRLDPYQMRRLGFNGRLLTAARAAADANQTTLALRLYPMMGSDRESLEYMQGRLAQMPQVSPELQQELTELEAAASAEDNFDIITEMSLGALHERMLNVRAAYSLYSQLVADHPAQKFRPDFLYGATRCAVAIGKTLEAEFYGMTFRREFPEHEYMPFINSLLLESLFYAGKYEEAVDIASRIRLEYPDDAPERELTDFVYACGNYYLNNPVIAQPELDSHVERFPESRFRETVAFCRASNMLRLPEPDYAKSGELFDAFLEEFQDSGFTPYALLDRSTVHFQLDEYSKLLTGPTQRLLADFPQFTELDRAYNMRGDAFYVEENYEQAESSYLRAKELAEAMGEDHIEVAARALTQLVALKAEQGEAEAVIGYYDEFIEGYEESFYEAQVVVTALPSLAEEGRAEEALARMETVIVRVAGGAAGVGLEEAINSYAKFYLEEIGAEQLEQRLLDFPEKVVPAGEEVPDALKAWLLIARIGLYEDGGQGLPGVEAKMNLAYQELQNFDKSILDPFIMVKVGLDLEARGTEASLAEAQDWFKAVIDLGASPHYPVALLGQAKLAARRGEANAIELFENVITQLADSGERDYVIEARLAKGRLLFDAGQYRRAIDESFMPLIEDPLAVPAARSELFFKLGRSFEELEDWDKALEGYQAFFAPPHWAVLEFAAEGRVRAAQIQWARGQGAGAEQIDRRKKAFELVRQTLAQYYQRYAADARTGGWIEKAAEFYRDWGSELGMVANRNDEIDWGLPEVYQLR